MDFQQICANLGSLKLDKLHDKELIFYLLFGMSCLFEATWQQLFASKL
jgi:hypothetical protein